jgi:hypothetical protein
LTCQSVSSIFSERILKDIGIRCKRPKLELEHGPDYDEGGKEESKELQKQIALS